MGIWGTCWPKKMFQNGNSVNLLERGVLNLEQFGEFWKFLFQFGKVCVGEERVEGARQRRGCQGRALHHQDATLYHIVIFI